MSNFKKHKEILILILLFIIFTPIFLTPWVHHNDGAGYYSYVRSAFIDGDLDLKNEKDFFSAKFAVSSIQEDESTGVYFSQYPIGVPLLWSPFFALGHGIANLSGSVLNGYSTPYVYMVNLGSAIFGFLGLLLIYSFCSNFFRKSVVLLSTVTFWLSSSVFYYMYFEGTMSHAISMFSVALFIYWWYKTLKNRTFFQWFVLGILSALMIMVRYQNGFFMILPLYFSIKTYHSLVKIRSRRVLNLFYKNIFFLFSLLIGLIPQFIVLNYQHGTYFSALTNYQTSINYVAGSYNWIRVLFSADHGLFVWTPVILLSFLGILLAIKRFHAQKHLMVAFLLAFCLQLFFVASISAWNGAQSYGHRMFLNCSLIFVFGFCHLINLIYKRYGWKIPLLMSFVLICWNFNLMVQYGFRLIPSDGAINFWNVLKNTFTKLPHKLFAFVKIFMGSRGDLTS